MSWREYRALCDVHDQKMFRWAVERAEFRNGHFNPEGCPWIPDDFLGGEPREVRKAAAARDQLALARVNARLAKINPDEIPDDLPEWARPAVVN